MILKPFILGHLENNNYLLIDDSSKEAILIDCSEKSDEMISALKEYKADLKYILITHGHFDHVGGINEFKAIYPKCKVLIHKNAQPLLDAMDKFVSKFDMPKVENPKIDGYIDENQVIEFGENKIKTIHTPGHSAGGVCFLVENIVFTGDTLFYESVGRTDLPSGSFKQLKSSIQEKLFQLDRDTKVYPGHGRPSTIGHEKDNNKFL